MLLAARLGGEFDESEGRCPLLFFRLWPRVEKRGVNATLEVLEESAA